MKLEKLKPGMTVYDVHSYKMGNTSLRTVGVWNVCIIEVDLDRRSVLASWNGNEPKRYPENMASKWRASKPLLIDCAFGRKRMATREEIKAHKEKTQARRSEENLDG
jgi:hypothetical protein